MLSRLPGRAVGRDALYRLRRAESFGGLRGAIKELLVGDLEAAGFKDVRIDIVSQAALAANPRDRTPAAGDIMYYGVLEALV